MRLDEKTKQFRRVLSFLLVFAFLLCAGVGHQWQAVYASDTQSTQERLEELRKAIDAVRAEIDGLNKSIEQGKDVATAARNKQGALERQARLIEEQITLKLQAIEQQEQDIDQKVNEIAQKQQEYDQNDLLFQQRLVAIYKSNNSSLISVLLTVDSYSDFLTVNENLQRVSAHDSDLLATLVSQKEALEQAKADMEGMLASLEKDRQDLDESLRAYNASIQQQKAIASQALEQVEADEEELEKKYEDYKAFQNEMEALWNSLGGSEGEYIGGALEWPVPGYNGDRYISSHFGQRLLFGRPDFHTGIDIARGDKSSIFNAGIVAANGGTVIKVVSNSNYGYGRYVIVDHGGGVRTLYGHCESILVSEGQVVSRGQQIATVGNTGNSTGPHLHFELRVQGNQKVNPYPYLTGQKEL